MGNSFTTSSSLLVRLGDPSDERAWEEFVDRYGRVVFIWCRRQGMQKADTEDVTQGLLLKLLVEMRSFVYDRSKGKYRHWLHTLLKRVIADFFKRHRRDGGERMQPEGLNNLPDPASLFEPFMEACDLELVKKAEEHVRQEVQAKTWEAFCLLTKEYRTPEEVAVLVGMRVSQTYVAKHRVLKKLEKELRRLQECGGLKEP